MIFHKIRYFKLVPLSKLLFQFPILSIFYIIKSQYLQFKESKHNFENCPKIQDLPMMFAVNPISYGGRSWCTHQINSSQTAVFCIRYQDQKLKNSMLFLTFSSLPKFYYIITIVLDPWLTPTENKVNGVV